MFSKKNTKGLIRIHKSKDRQYNGQTIFDLILIFGVLTPLSAIFQLYHSDQFYGQKKKNKRTNNNLQNTTKKTKD